MSRHQSIGARLGAPAPAERRRSRGTRDARAAAGLAPFALGALGALGAALAGCSGSDAAASPQAEGAGARPRQLQRVRVEPVVQREMVQWLETTAVVESEREIQVYPRSGGQVIELLAEEGDRVEADAVLARLDALEQELAVREAEIALEESKNAAQRAGIAAQESESRLEVARRAAEQAKRDYERDQSLFESATVASALSARQVEASRLASDRAASEGRQAELGVERLAVEAASAKTAVTRAEALLARARVALAHMEIRAPFAGVIASRTLRLGDSVGAGAAVFSLTDIEHLRAVIHRPQRELPLFGGPARGEAALELSARAEALPGKVFRGTVQRTSPTVDAASGSFRVTAHLDPLPVPDGTGERTPTAYGSPAAEAAASGGSPAAEAAAGGRLLPGMLIRLRIATDRHGQALVVPKRALSREGDQSFVLAVRDSRVARVAVIEGYSDDESVEVRPAGGATLAAGETVVVVGSRELEEGEMVEIDAGVAPEAAAAAETEAPPAESDSPPAEPQPAQEG